MSPIPPFDETIYSVAAIIQDAFLAMSVEVETQIHH